MSPLHEVRCSTNFRCVRKFVVRRTSLNGVRRTTNFCWGKHVKWQFGVKSGSALNSDLWSRDPGVA
eukprot:11619174-Alexandrium_andersonii.AAC.1